MKNSISNPIPLLTVHSRSFSLFPSSKRIISVIPEYGGRKASAGPDIAEFIGIPAIRAKCPHFKLWLAQLENLSWEEE